MEDKQIVTCQIELYWAVQINTMAILVVMCDNNMDICGIYYTIETQGLQPFHSRDIINPDKR